LTTPFIALVHHIVVYETRRVQEFHRYGRMQRLRKDTSGELRKEQEELRTHHLTPTFGDVLKRLVQEMIGPFE
jgi:hypothetical protein